MPNVTPKRLILNKTFVVVFFFLFFFFFFRKKKKKKKNRRQHLPLQISKTVSIMLYHIENSKTREQTV